MHVRIDSLIFDNVCLPGTRKYTVSTGMNTLRIPKHMSGHLTTVLRCVLSFQEVPNENVLALSPGKDSESGTLAILMNVGGVTVKTEIWMCFTTGSFSTSISCNDDSTVEELVRKMLSHGLTDSCFIDGSDQFKLTSAFDRELPYADLVFGTEFIDYVSSLLNDANRMLIGRNGKYPAKNLNRLEMTMNKHRLSEHELREYRDSLMDSLHDIRMLSLSTRMDAGGISRRLVLRRNRLTDDDGTSLLLIESMLTLMSDPILVSRQLGESMKPFYDCLNPLGFPTISIQSLLSDIDKDERCICGRPMDEHSRESVDSFLKERSVPYPYSILRTIDFMDCSNLDSIAKNMQSVKIMLGRSGIPHKDDISWIRDLDNLLDSVESIRNFDLQERIVEMDLVSITKPDGNNDPASNLSACHEAINQTRLELKNARESLLINERKERLESFIESIWGETLTRLDHEAASHVNDALGEDLMILESERASIHPGCDRWLSLLIKALYLKEIESMVGVDLPLIAINCGSKVPREFDSLLSEFDLSLIVIGGV